MRPLIARIGELHSNRYNTMALSFSPEAFWKFTEQTGATVAADSSGNGHDLVYDATAELEYDSGTAVGKVARMTSNQLLAVSNAVIPELVILGDVTVFGIVSGLTGTDTWYFSVASDGDIEANNGTTCVKFESGRAMGTFWESGSGTNHQVNDDNSGAAPSTLSFTAFRRNATTNTLNFWMNGTKGEDLSYTTGPTGGGSNLVNIGGYRSGTYGNGLFRGIGVVKGLLTDTQIAELFATTGL